MEGYWELDLTSLLSVADHVTIQTHMCVTLGQWWEYFFFEFASFHYWKKNFWRRTRSLSEEQWFAILIIESRFVKVFFLFPCLEGGRKGQGCSYWDRIGQNDGFAAAIVVGEESKILFLEVEEGRKISFSFLDNTHSGDGLYKKFVLSRVTCTFWEMQAWRFLSWNPLLWSTSNSQKRAE